VPTAVKDLQVYFDTEGATTPALEFVSPVKGPNLENILIELGTGSIDARTAAERYDQDVEKQAQQLGLEGW
jgi:raffinose/stachyose/melibiose transport system substrate-binding protein